MKMNVSWDLIGPEAEGIAVLSDEFALPARLTAQFRSGEGGHHVVELVIVIRDGQPECDELRVIREAGEPALTGEELRRIPLQRFVTMAAATATYVPISDKTPEGDEGIDIGSDRRWTLAQPEDKLRARDLFDGRRRKRVLTTEHLEEVAEIYRANAESGAPNVAVADHFVVSKSTAARWVMEARKRGLLPPTQRGKVAT